ncbi:MAG: hypothetical protein ACF8MF_10120 [Phycisphaerales bacterium JB052]
MNKALTIAAIAGFGAIATAGPAALQITEAFVGLSGEDGTQDWFEVTNISNSTIDTGNYWYDDDSATVADGGQLDSIMLGAGESMIFLVSDDNSASDDDTYSSAIEEFQSIWNYSGLIGLTNGGGGLGQSGDSIFLLLGDDTVLTSQEVPGALSGALSSIDFVNGPALSTLGVNGAYESNAFFNDNLGLPNDSATLIGSPGSVPTPGSVALLAIAGLTGARRRRA